MASYDKCTACRVAWSILAGVHFAQLCFPWVGECVTCALVCCADQFASKPGTDLTVHVGDSYKVNDSSSSHHSSVESTCLGKQNY